MRTPVHMFFECQRTFCSGFLLSVRACTAVAVPSYTEAFLPLCLSTSWVLSAWIHWFTHLSAYCIFLCMCLRGASVCVCTDPGQLLLQGLLGGLRAAVQLGALLTHNLSQPLYSAPFCLQQLTRLTYTHVHRHRHTYTPTHACTQWFMCTYEQRDVHARTHTNTRQREDGSVSGTGEPQLVTTATRSARLA